MNLDKCALIKIGRPDKKRDFYLLNTMKILTKIHFMLFIRKTDWFCCTSTILMQVFWVTVFGYPLNPKKLVLVSNSEGLLEPLSPYHIMCTKSDLPCMEHNPLLNLPPPPCDQGLAGRCRSYWPECNFPPSSFIITVILDSQRLIVMSEIMIW